MLLRWDVESNDPVPGAAIDAIHSTAMESVADVRILVISDYGLGVVEEGRTRDLIEAARSAGTIIISDPKLTGLHRVKGSRLGPLRWTGARSPEAADGCGHGRGRRHHPHGRA